MSNTFKLCPTYFSRGANNFLGAAKTPGYGPGRASHLVHKFDKQIARCNNSHIKILNLFVFPHVLSA